MGAIFRQWATILVFSVMFLSLPLQAAEESESTTQNSGETPSVVPPKKSKEKSFKAKKQSPLRARGLHKSADYSDEERAELDALEEMVKRFEKSATEYRELTRRVIEYKYEEKKTRVFNAYETLIRKLEDEQRERRLEAIARFEIFLERHPDDPTYSPDAMFRLAELYFERSYDVYFQARQIFDDQIDAWEPDSGVAEPEEPIFRYEPTIATMQRLITEFPEYRLIDGAYYLLGYCLGEQGEEERAVDVYQELADNYPDSRFAPEVWTRIGEYYFAISELDRALSSYTHVLDHQDSPYYDKAM